MNAIILAVALCNIEPMTLDSYNAQHDSCYYRPLTKVEKSTLTQDLVKQVDEEIEALFKLAYYAYQERDYDAMIDIFDMIDKHERLRQLTLLNMDSQWILGTDK